MNIQRVLDSIYLIPVILDHLEAPTLNTERILVQNGIHPREIEELRKIQHLLDYHWSVVRNNFAPNYSYLRQGLKEYFDEYLSDVFKKLKFTDGKYTMLDYGCGMGYYGKQFAKDNPMSEITLMDKDFSNEAYTFINDERFNINLIKDDFEANPNWFMNRNLLGYFDVILMSELLHCKDEVMCKYLISSCCSMLSKGSSLIVIENQDLCMEYRITKLKGSPRPVIDMMTMDRLTKFMPLRIKHILNINQHYIYLYEKI